jgi:hypothetical protein
MSLDTKIHIVVICAYSTYIRQNKFIQGYAISSKYTINEYLKMNLKIIQEYLHNAHIQNLKSVYDCKKNLVIQYLFHDCVK